MSHPARTHRPPLLPIREEVAATTGLYAAPMPPPTSAVVADPDLYPVADDLLCRVKAAVARLALRFDPARSVLDEALRASLGEWPANVVEPGLAELRHRLGTPFGRRSELGRLSTVDLRRPDNDDLAPMDVNLRHGLLRTERRCREAVERAVCVQHPGGSTLGLFLDRIALDCLPTEDRLVLRLSGVAVGPRGVAQPLAPRRVTIRPCSGLMVDFPHGRLLHELDLPSAFDPGPDLATAHLMLSRETSPDLAPVAAALHRAILVETAQAIRLPDAAIIGAEPAIAIAGWVLDATLDWLRVLFWPGLMDRQTTRTRVASSSRPLEIASPPTRLPLSVAGIQCQVYAYWEIQRGGGRSAEMAGGSLRTPPFAVGM